VLEATRRAPISKTLFVVASKSGSTAEIMAFLDHFWAKAKTELGAEAPQHFVVVTDPGSALGKLAMERNFRAVIEADPNVGGRFSGLIAFGILPSALMGHDTADLLKRAQKFAAECAVDVPAGRNPGLVLGALLGEAALAGRDKLSIITDPAFASLGSWMEQLIAESSGKDGVGIVPVDGEPVVIPPASETDRLYVYIRQDGTRQAAVTQLRSLGHPVLVLNVPQPAQLFAEFYRWEMAISYACMVLKVNTFDQPNVQLSKTLTKDYLKAYQSSGSLELGEILWQNDLGQVYGKSFEGLNQATGLNDVIGRFVALAGAGDYIALNAYLPRNDAMTEALEKLRHEIAGQTHKAVTLGFGPRFQHSTGQLHKGGKNNILVLYITADPAVDFEVPTQDISFGTLELAQALGDLQANLNVGRRGIRIHLTKGGIKDLLR
jgi:transaldolase/glucose-6-phosphate isomerase